MEGLYRCNNIISRCFWTFYNICCETTENLRRKKMKEKRMPFLRIDTIFYLIIHRSPYFALQFFFLLNVIRFRLILFIYLFVFIFFSFNRSPNEWWCDYLVAFQAHVSLKLSQCKLQQEKENREERESRKEKKNTNRM